jgi:hypothetical protein
MVNSPEYDFMISRLRLKRLDGGRRIAENIQAAYEPLSSGLDIVRKTLGQHGIASRRPPSTRPPER